MNVITGYLKDFASLIFPELCQACGDSLVNTEKHFCTTCIYQLPYTNYHLVPDNRLAKQFWGRVNINAATAFLYFNKAGKVQNMMHQLKYNNQPQIGEELGKMFGKQLKETFPYHLAEAIIPVPLHPKKLIKRGYNQSETFANGLAEILQIPVVTDLLFRDKAAESQTAKSRSSRFENMKTVFKALDNQHSYKSVLLVDDTITTGATLEACAFALQEIGIKEINIVGIAFTE
ncbi:ComF family protein [Pedobacter cryophilus]|uniref:ComF family protein n=1 Tax=Pedobacter cryophilus TaxID=2571271 RepID=A0A4U1C7D6_9SPHI|nr:ComF family protein [Pedobacter cryophilus]TKC00574.1 ComF family protein [Pedobacter cryophilus]